MLRLVRKAKKFSVFFAIMFFLPTLAFANSLSVTPTSGTDGIVSNITATVTDDSGLSRVYTFNPNGTYAGRTGLLTNGVHTDVISAGGINFVFTGSNSSGNLSSHGEGIYTFVLGTNVSCLNQTLTYCQTNNPTSASATYNYSTTPPPTPPSGGGGLILPNASSTALVITITVNTGILIAIVVGSLLIGVIALMGLGYAIRKIRNKILDQHGGMRLKK